jgi:hypothetical protein
MSYISETFPPIPTCFDIPLIIVSSIHARDQLDIGWTVNARYRLHFLSSSHKHKRFVDHRRGLHSTIYSLRATASSAIGGKLNARHDLDVHKEICREEVHALRTFVIQPPFIQHAAQYTQSVGSAQDRLDRHAISRPTSSDTCARTTIDGLHSSMTPYPCRHYGRLHIAVGCLSINLLPKTRMALTWLTQWNEKNLLSKFYTSIKKFIRSIIATQWY